MMEWGYGHGTEASVSGGPRAGASVSGGPSGKSTNRFGPSESNDSRSSLGGSDLYRSGNSYNEPEPSSRNSLDSFGGRNQGGASWEASLARAKMRTGFMDESGRESYSSYNSFASPPMKPAPAGSRGRGMPSFPEGALGSRSYEAFGGMPAGRGRGMGLLIVVDYQNKTVFGAVPGGPAGRGTKREMMPPPNTPVAGALDHKKPKLAKSEENTNKEPDAKNKEEVEKRRAEARLKKKMRKRERYGYRSGFTCVFCKFGTFEDKQIEAHLASTSHQETLKHIQAQTKFDKVFMEFLHESVVDKFKKTSLRIARNQQLVAAKMKERDLLEGVTSDDHMMKMETIHCSACSMYFTASRNSIHEHINSSDHAKCKQAFKQLIKRESVFTATSFFNNPLVKARYEKFAKGENPFETTDENAAEANENEDNVEDEDSGEEAAEPK